MRKEKLGRANSLAQGHSSGAGGGCRPGLNPRLPASRACHPGNLGCGWMTPGPQDPHCHQGCFPGESPVPHPVHPCPQVLGGLCSFHSGPSFCTLPPKATPPPRTPSVSEDVCFTRVGPGEPPGSSSSESTNPCLSRELAGALQVCRFLLTEKSPPRGSSWAWEEQPRDRHPWVPPAQEQQQL